MIEQVIPGKPKSVFLSSVHSNCLRINFLLLLLEQELFCMDSVCNVVLSPAGVQRMKRKMERFTEMNVGLPSR